MSEASVPGGLLAPMLRFFTHMRPRRRKQFAVIAFLMVVSALLEVVSLGAVLPFIGVYTDPARVFQYPYVARLAGAMGITSPDELMLPLTFGFVLAVIFAAAMRLLLLWASTRLTLAVGADISAEVYRRTLFQPYEVHVSRNSSEMINAIAIKINAVVFGVLLAALTLAGSSTMLIAMVVTLVIINPSVALLAAVGFTSCYLLIARAARDRLKRNSRRVADEQTNTLKALQEGLGGIRDVLLDGTQEVYCDIYRQADVPLRWAQGNSSFISHSPRHVMEALGMVLIAGLTWGLSRGEGGVAMALPVLGALALGAQRLIPALQQGFTAWANMATNHAALLDVLDLLDQPLPEDMLLPRPKALAFSDSIRFDAVRFRYSKDGPWILDGMDLVIPRGARVGVIGVTGSGKSTAMDVLMGLLSPTEGAVRVDGEPLRSQRIRAWQRTIAHVPQSIFLADTTLAENIAFGVPPKDIDMEKVRQAAAQAQISEFIESRPLGYQSTLGERGIRLSGGQRQRIGIARALYKQASVLVFDEATSALDNATERSVMDAIEGLNRDLTIIIIAHRLNTVARCDTVFELAKGRVASQGTYEQLSRKNSGAKDSESLR